MDSLMPAPRHSTCSGACEGCKAYPKCPEEVYCDDLNCRYSCPDYSIPGWSCARESKISDMILSFTDDKDLPLCPYFEQRSAEEEQYEGDTPLGDCLKCKHLEEFCIKIDHYEKWDGYYCSKAEMDRKTKTCANYKEDTSD
jgi:hypothetical protein